MYKAILTVIGVFVTFVLWCCVRVSDDDWRE